MGANVKFGHTCRMWHSGYKLTGGLAFEDYQERTLDVSRPSVNPGYYYYLRTGILM